MMHFKVFFLIVAIFLTALANPLPLDSVDPEPYPLPFVDPETFVSTPDSIFLSENLQPSTPSSIQVDPIQNDEYASTNLPQVPCDMDQASVELAEDDSGFCRIKVPTIKWPLNWPTFGTEQKPEPPPKKVEQPRKVPPVPSMLHQSDGENMCDPSSDFNQHLCCDGSIGVATEYAGQRCFYLIEYCHHCESPSPPPPTTVANFNDFVCTQTQLHRANGSALAAFYGLWVTFWGVERASHWYEIRRERVNDLVTTAGPSLEVI